MTTSKIQKPTVGRIVHFGALMHDETPSAAIIAALGGDETCLVVFDKTSVYFRVAKQSDGYKFNHWWWPEHE